jgi:hypothetical protein
MIEILIKNKRYNAFQSMILTAGFDELCRSFKMTTFEERCPKKSSKIALVADASADYHFLRQDSNQYWSQKSGARPVTDRDASGHRIWNPQLSDLDFRKNDSSLNYDIFCSYMCVPRTKALYMKVGGTRKKYSR